MNASWFTLSCLVPNAGLDKQKGVYAKAVATLANPNLTWPVLGAHPQPLV